MSAPPIAPPSSVEIEPSQAFGWLGSGRERTILTRSQLPVGGGSSRLTLPENNVVPLGHIALKPVDVQFPSLATWSPSLMWTFTTRIGARAEDPMEPTASAREPTAPVAILDAVTACLAMFLVFTEFRPS